MKNKTYYILITALVILAFQTVKSQEIPCTQYYADTDNDGLGDPLVPVASNYLGSKSCFNLDCDDTDPQIGQLKWIVFTEDLDGDGYPAPYTIYFQCNSPGPLAVEYSIGILTSLKFIETDCDDTDPNVFAPSVYFFDSDGDGFGDINVTEAFCSRTPSANYVATAGDNCPDLYGTFNGCPDEIIEVSDALVDNAILTINYRVPLTLSELANADWDDKITTKVQFDGLGRMKHKINVAASPSGRDIVTLYRYDGFGRQPVEFLPYPSVTTGGATGTGIIEFTSGASGFSSEEDLQSSYYYNNYPEDVILDPNVTTNPFAPSSFSASATIEHTTVQRGFDFIDRVIAQGAAGSDWSLESQNTINFVYGFNQDQEVKRLAVSHPNGDTEQIDLVDNNDFYYANELFKIVTKDENHDGSATKNHTTEEFKDKQGRVVLKRTYNDDSSSGGSTEEAYDTYYIYDDFGNLTFVLPPKSDAHTAKPDPVELSELCYQYKYDYRNRLIEKKVPGKGWEYIVYNKLDLPVMTQDTEQRLANKWLFTKYDAFGRVVYTGIYTDTINTTRSAMQTETGTVSTLAESRIGSPVTLDNMDLYYTRNAFPNAGTLSYLMVNYYDDYNWNPNGGVDASYDFTLNNDTYFSFLNGTLTKTNTSISYNAGFLTDKTIQGDGYIQYTVTQTNSQRVLVGLSKADETLNNNWITIDYGIFTGTTNNDKLLRIREEGIYRGIAPVSYEAGDVLRIERSGNQILYKKNNIVFYVSGVPSTGELIGDASFYDPNTAISNIHIGYSSYGQQLSNTVKGLATGSLIRVLGTNDWTTTTTYYDDKGRPVHSTSENDYLNTSDVVSSLLDFIGKPLKNKTSHIKGSNNAIVIEDFFTYDHADRLLTQEQLINSGSKQLIATNHYDELGQLTQKLVAGTIDTASATTNAVNVTVSGNIITKTGGVNSTWDAGLSTINSISGDGYVTYTLSRNVHSTMIGLSYTDTNQNFNTIDYAIYTRYDGLVRVYESGSNKGDQTTYMPEDIFRVERIGTIVYYLKNNEVFYVSAIASNGNAMIGDISMNNIGSEVKNFAIVDTKKSLQTVDYTYNIRGWLKSINDVNTMGNDLFAFNIKYNDIADASKKLYNGNISQTNWNTESVNTSGNPISNSYTYTYDALNRITGGVNTTNSNYDLSSINYDKNGNIIDLMRNGHTNDLATTFGTMDNLSYYYNGNQLHSVTDGSGKTTGFNDGNISDNDFATTADNDFMYDVNGNMKTDANKGITNIQYNHLNLPIQVTLSSGNIEYIYDATGLKLKKIVSTGGTTEYAGNYIYKDNVLQFFNHPEGYVEPYGSGGYDYVYQYKDHLGNIRLSYKDVNGNYEQILDSDFTNDFTGWTEGGSVNFSLDAGRLKANVNSSWEGYRYFLDEFTAVAGETLKINVVFDKGNTMSNVRIYLPEYDPNGNLVSYNVLDGNMQTGNNTYTFLMSNTGNTLKLNIDKDNTNTSTETYLFLDNVTMTFGELQILEENNYYPFGLKHKGYNNVVNGTEHKYKFNGVELNESLGLNLYEMDLRSYDPAIGRWNRIDPVTHYNLSPYNAFDNNPIFFSDPSGGNSNALMSTVVNDDGEVIDHRDDGDPNIYLNSRSGAVVGQEEEGVEYNAGDKIFNVDKSNPDYSVYSLIAATAESVIKSSTVYTIPQSIPIYDKAGKLIGRWITKIKVPFKALKLVGGVLKPVSGAFTFLSTASDVIDYSNGQISGTRLGYRTTGTVATIITSSAVGGPVGIAAGVIVGTAFYAGEIIYDGVKASNADRSDPDNNANTIHSIGEFRRNFSWFLNNLGKGLGDGF